MVDFTYLEKFTLGSPESDESHLAGVSVDLLHHEDVAGAVVLSPALLLLSLLGGDQTEEPPVVTVDSTEPEWKISLLSYVTESLLVG